MVKALMHIEFLMNYTMEKYLKVYMYVIHVIIENVLILNIYF